jgi:sarcosine oxidase, subunit gamma
MKPVLRSSPIHNELQRHSAIWKDVNGMRSISRVSGSDRYQEILGIADLSFLKRFGVKGSNAATWLNSQNLPIPDKPNTWCRLSDGGLIARLGISEFLIEDSIDSRVVDRLTEACQTLPERVYPVLRQDLAIALCGNSIQDLLLQTCGINFRALSLPENPLVLTSMIGVSVLVIPNETIYRIWCDGTFGVYFWQTLLEMAEELGGGPIGFEQLPPITN